MTTVVSNLQINKDFCTNCESNVYHYSTQHMQVIYTNVMLTLMKLKVWNGLYVKWFGTTITIQYLLSGSWQVLPCNVEVSLAQCWIYH